MQKSNPKSIRRRSVVVLVGLTTLLAAVLVFTASAGASTEYFNGAWHGTDLGDGSAQFLTVTGGSTKTVVYYDTSAFPCRSLGYSNPAVLVTGTGIVGSDGTTMTATNMNVVCVANPGVVLFQVTLNFWVNGDGTISDDTSGGAFWLRGTGTPASGTAGSNVPTGTRIGLFVPPTTFPANTPFYVEHGFGCIPGVGTPAGCQLGTGTFSLYVDGVLQPSTKVVDGGAGGVAEAWLTNFPNGLPAGDHTLVGVWTVSGVVTGTLSATITFT